MSAVAWQMTDTGPVARPGPREGRDPLPANLTGTECRQPSQSGLFTGTTHCQIKGGGPTGKSLAGWVCTTPPSMATEFLHRWGGITVNAPKLEQSLFVVRTAVIMDQDACNEPKDIAPQN